jgi:hypothetical protein
VRRPNPARIQNRALAQDALPHGARCRAERHPDPELTGSLADGIRENAVHPDRRQKERHSAEDPHQSESELLALHVSPENLLHGPGPVDHELRIDGVQLPPDLRENPESGIRLDHLDQGPVAVVSVLGMRDVDLRFSAPPGVERHVGHHADDRSHGVG